MRIIEMNLNEVIALVGERGLYRWANQHNITYKRDRSRSKTLENCKKAIEEFLSGENNEVCHYADNDTTLDNHLNLSKTKHTNKPFDFELADKISTRMHDIATRIGRDCAYYCGSWRDYDVFELLFEKDGELSQGDKPAYALHKDGKFTLADDEVTVEEIDANINAQQEEFIAAMNKRIEEDAEEEMRNWDADDIFAIFVGGAFKRKCGMLLEVFGTTFRGTEILEVVGDEDCLCYLSKLGIDLEDDKLFKNWSYMNIDDEDSCLLTKKYEITADRVECLVDKLQYILGDEEMLAWCEEHEITWDKSKNPKKEQEHMQEAIANYIYALDSGGMDTQEVLEALEELSKEHELFLGTYNWLMRKKEENPAAYAMFLDDAVYAEVKTKDELAEYLLNM
ncbi:MAG: hypothetical protein Q4D21_08340 [Phascolarctobacterium sp.]|nr:hypothetical protein [Phascolarctobacterium sp.]